MAWTNKASAEAEADICATQLFKLLRERDVNGRHFMGQQQNNSQQTQSEPAKDAVGYQFYREGFGWDRGRGNGEQLTNLMIRHNVGVRTEETVYLKKMDEDFFQDE